MNPRLITAFRMSLLAGCTSSALAQLGASTAHAAAVTTLASFNLTNGASSYGGLIADADGNLFGTTSLGGTNGLGTVFQMAKTSTGYGPVTTLASFTGSDGAKPFAGLIADASGNLFGTTIEGGTNNSGTVFQIAKTGTGYGAITTLASFTGSNGATPYAALVADADGNLFGTTSVGGANNKGTVFEIAKTGAGYGAVTTLVSFTGSDGATSAGSLIADAAGNLFGTTYAGTQSLPGSVFQIAKTGTGYGPLTTLASLGSSEELFIDAGGNIIGTRSYGGTGSFGTAFKIASTGTGYGAVTTIANFSFSNASPAAGLIADAAGNLFGTTSYGGTSNAGTVFKIANNGGSYGPVTTLASFTGGNGASPYAGLIADAAGDLFGVTVGGGSNNRGTVYMVTGSGFVTATTGIDVPEPASLALTVAGLAAFAGLRRRSPQRTV